MAEEVEEIMAQAMYEAVPNRDLFQYPWPSPFASVREWYRTQARAGIAALHAHGYEIKRRDPDMLSIAEVSTDRRCCPGLGLSVRV